jgi:tetraacyldisaccharide 4'-kinase
MVTLEQLAARPIVAVAAIAKPEAFFQMLSERGVRPTTRVALPDHDDFAAWQRPPGDDYTLLCTEKDAQKLWRHAPDALAVPLLFEPEPAFFRALDAKLSSADGHQAA